MSFSDIPTTVFDLENVFCIPETYIPSCSAGFYYDSILESCTSCPTGCATCTSESQCTSCQVSSMIVNVQTGLCQCPSQQYFYQVDYPRCRCKFHHINFVACLSKCATCNNEFKCLTYQTCPNSLQTLASGSCSFKCTSGSSLTATTCGTCSDTNCQICDQVGAVQRCGLCQNGYYLDLTTYQCVQTCPTLSKAISSTNTKSNGSSVVNYCRPYINGTTHNYVYYVDPSSTSHLELGTFEYPFKNLASSAVEILNFMYDKDTVSTTYVKRGTTLKLYYGVMPIVLVNVKKFIVKSYGNFTLPKPYIYITGHEYLWPDSTLFSVAETYYNLNLRVSRGDMDVSEATKFFLKYNVFRSSLDLIDVDFQSIMFGDAWSSPLVFSFDAQNQTVTMDNVYLDLDGSLYECYFPISVRITNSHVNLTNYQYGVWNDFRWDCQANNATTLGGSFIFENSLITGHHQQALYNFFYFASFDDFILNNNTFDACTYLDMETRPFIDVHPQSMCDPSFRTQKVFIDNNKFINLQDSNLIFAVNYMYDFSGTKIFSMQNNTFENSIINTQFIQFQIQKPSVVTVANNYYHNITVLKDKKIFYFFSDQSNLTITNETLVNNTLDDLYTIGAAANIIVQNFSVINNKNTGSITETSAILRISTANTQCTIKNFTVQNSQFMYGKAIEIESAQSLDFRDAVYTQNSLQNQDFFVFNQIVKSTITNLKFQYFTKQSDKSRFAISMPTLTLTPGISKHDISNINFTDSQASFLSVSQVQLQSANDMSSYQYNIKNCIVRNNTLSSKDSLIEFGEINYINFLVTLSDVNILNNSLELGTIYSLKMNCKQMLIKDSMITNNNGQFAALEPASSDVTNPLIFNLTNTMFYNNYAKADALIQLTTNSIMNATNSNFTENYSIGRGAIVFADYQAVYAFFRNCTFARNYAYQGGAFYIQYSSVAELSNCTVVDNFAVTGGVAYVNNDGRIKLNNGTQVYKNSALNTCFLFLINTQYESLIDNITITKNDQVNALINKDIFLQQNANYKHIQKTFFVAMQAIADKVQRTIKEKADSAVYAIKAKVNFTNTDIYENDLFLAASTESSVLIGESRIRDLVANGKIFQAVSSTIELRGLTLENISYNKPSGDTSNFYKISIVNKSTLKASNCTIRSIKGLLLYVSGSTLMITHNSTFYNTTNDDRDSSLLAIDTSTVNISDSRFHNISSLYYSPIITLQTNQVTVKSTNFSHFDKTLFALDGGNYIYNNVSISHGQMTWQTGERSFMVNSIVFDVASANLELTNSTISGIFTNYSSPVVYIENDATASSTILLNLTQSTFANNIATENAGVIYSLNTDVFINNSRFENNSALTYDGGALYLDCQDNALYKCRYNISNSLFQNNTALINGGAIKFTYYRPNLTNNVFTNNKAIYGPTMASYPLQMFIKDSSTARRSRQLAMLSSAAVTALGIKNGVVFQLDTPLVSGSLISQNVSLILVDDTNRTIITDNSSVAVMSAVSSNLQVMKSKSVKATQGIFRFDDVIIIGPPGSDILLKITSDSISTSKIQQAFPQMGTIPDIYVKGSLRLCTRGEYQTSDNKCIVCSDGFYTLMANQKSCNECPENSVCTEGYKITVDPGYWRKDVNSTAIYSCYNNEACLGGYEVQCAAGYGGNLCQSCVEYNDINYSRESSNQCAHCIAYSTNSWRLAGVTILVVIYFIILIFINIRTAGQQKVTTVYMRILTNYFQILTLASSYDLSWNDNMKKFLEAISFIAESSNIILSIDCFIKDNNLGIEPHYIKMIIACLFPLICIAVVSVFWGVVHLVKKNVRAMTKFVMSVIILIFITLPPITTITFAIYNCIDIFGNGETYLALDMSLQCWAGDHNFYAKAFGIPVILTWILGLPLVAFFILFRKRHKLGEDENITRYGFLYVGLNHSAFYWEILLHFRKVLMISINVFFTTFKPLYRALIGFMLMIIYIEVLQKVQPYQTPDINDLEFKANIAAFATFYGGLFFISDDLPFGVTILLFILILMINVIFWFTWIKMMFNNWYLKLKNFLMRVFCKAKYAKAQIDLEKIENLDFDDTKKPIDPEASHDKSYNYDESHRYALAHNDSHRVDDSARQDPSALIINGYSHKKDVTRSKKTLKKRGKHISSSDTPISESNDSSLKARRKHDKKKKPKKVETYSDDTVSDESISDSEKDHKKKKSTRRKKKDSTSDFETTKKDLQSTPSLEKANAGEIIDQNASSQEMQRSPQSKPKKTGKKKSAEKQQTIKEKEFSIVEVQPYNKLTTGREKERSKSRDEKHKKPEPHLSISSEDAEPGVQYIKPPQHGDRSRSRSKSNKRVNEEQETIRAFRSPASTSHVSQKPIDYGDEQAKVHTIKYKKGARNSTNKKDKPVAKEDRLFEKKHMGKTAQQRVDEDDSSSAVEQPRRRDRDQEHQKKSKSRQRSSSSSFGSSSDSDIKDKQKRVLSKTQKHKTPIEDSSEDNQAKKMQQTQKDRSKSRGEKKKDKKKLKIMDSESDSDKKHKKKKSKKSKVKEIDSDTD